MVQDAELGKRFVDKLAKVAYSTAATLGVCASGSTRQRRAEFAERMFVYHYRLFDRYRQPVASLALLAIPLPAGDPASLVIGRWAVRLS